MRTDVLDLHGFYESPLGAMARGFIMSRLAVAWGGAQAQRVAGFGFATPYLCAFPEAERALALAPDAQGVIAWPNGSGNRAGLVEENRWPLPDASIDRLLIIHGLEEASDPRRLMREAWRVLTNDGRLIIVAAHRRGLWSVIDTTPFAAGRPYLKRQLYSLLESAMFKPEWLKGALYFPPFGARFLLRAASAWERAGARVWPGLGGVLMVEATKELLSPVVQVQRSRQRALRPAATRPAAATRVIAERRALP